MKSVAQIRIVLVDDHHPSRRGLRRFLERQSNISIVGEATNGDEGLKLLSHTPCDLLLLDIAMPVMNGYEMVRHLRQQRTSLDIIVFSSYMSPESIFKMLSLGIDAFLSKEDELQDVYKTILAVSQGENGIISPLVTPKLHVIHTSSVSRGSLTTTEQNVLSLMALGYTNIQIARRLMIQENQVQAHEACLLQKLNVPNRLLLVEWAWSHDIAKLN